jgi:hypothetical protein
MDADAIAQQFQAHQDAVLTLLDRGCLRRADGVPDPDAVARTRWELVRALRTYQLFKHRCVFDPAIASGDPVRADLARTLKERCLLMDAAYRDHAQRWTGSGVIDRWAEYRTAATAMARRLRSHMLDERMGVVALLRGAAASVRPPLPSASAPAGPMPPRRAASLR